MSSSFQQNWIHSIWTSFAKVVAVQVFWWILTGDGPESPAHRSLRPKGPGISGPVFFTAKCLLVVRYWTGVRRYPGDGPESPAHRSLRPKGPGISGPRFFSALLRFCGAVLDRGPEPPSPPRRVSGVSGLTGVSGPLDRNLRPAPMIQQARSLAGISGPGRSLRTTYTGVSGLRRL